MQEWDVDGNGTLELGEFISMFALDEGVFKFPEREFDTQVKAFLAHAGNEIMEQAAALKARFATLFSRDCNSISPPFHAILMLFNGRQAEILARNEAASLIQGAMLGNQSRGAVSEMRLDVETTAAQNVQGVMQGKADRQAVEGLRNQAETTAARAVQSAVAGRGGRNAVDSMRAEAEARSASAIQGILMGKASRDSVAEFRAETEEAAAAGMNAAVRARQQRVWMKSADAEIAQMHDLFVEGGALTPAPPHCNPLLPPTPPHCVTLCVTRTVNPTP